MVPSKNIKSASKQVHDTTETKVIENANIMDVMLESVRNEREDEITDLAAANSSQPVGKEVASDVSLNSNQTSLAGCRYCTFKCHCSPGRKQKRPYPENCPPYVDDDLKSHPKLLNLPDVQKEVRNYKTTRMNNEESESRLNMFNVVETYANQAKDVILSSHEVFDLAGFFNDNHNPTDFTREQVRELLSVENTQDTLRKVYKSAYGGEGYSDEESDSSDSDSELGSVEGEEDKEWTDRQIEDY